MSDYRVLFTLTVILFRELEQGEAFVQCLLIIMMMMIEFKSFRLVSVHLFLGCLTDYCNVFRLYVVITVFNYLLVIFKFQWLIFSFHYVLHFIPNRLQYIKDFPFITI